MPQFYNTKIRILLFSSAASEVLLYEVYKHPFLFRMKNINQYIDLQKKE